MNIFKKDLDITFTDKVKSRIIQDIQSYLLIYRKKVLKPLWTAMYVTIGFTILNFAYNYFLDSNTSTLIEAGFYLMSSLTIGSYLALVMLLVYRIEHLDKLKRKAKLLNLSDFTAKIFAHEDPFEQFLFLNKEEVQELFTLQMSPEQLDYLQEIIVAKQNISLDAFEYLPNILSVEEAKKREEEREQLELKYGRSQLDKFLSDYELKNSFNGQELIDRFNKKSLTVNEQEKETH